MIFEYIDRATLIITRAFEWLFATILNIILVPLSYLYTVITRTMSNSWRLSNLSGVYYFWWSNRDKILKCSDSLGLTGIVGKYSKHPRMFVLVFTLMLLPIIAAAGGTKLIQKFSRFMKRNNNKFSVIDVNVIDQDQVNHKTDRGNE